MWPRFPADHPQLLTRASASPGARSHRQPSVASRRHPRASSDRLAGGHRDRLPRRRRIAHRVGLFLFRYRVRLRCGRLCPVLFHCLLTSFILFGLLFTSLIIGCTASHLPHLSLELLGLTLRQTGSLLNEGGAGV
jgi:hypothetical protein